MTVPEFQHTVKEYYRTYARSLPWRNTTNPYHIVVSELMLQQTQVERVIPKYEKFIHSLPTWQSLAQVSTEELLGLWQGLGYNRRALNLKRMAQVVVEEYGGVLPQDKSALMKLPGIGEYTAGAVLSFAFTIPTVMIETNIRRVFIHHFFDDREDVTDKELFPLIEQSLDREHPREWYWALMDYGSYLARAFPNANRRSKHYTKQSRFEGSLRQVRGEIVRFMTKNRQCSLNELVHTLGREPERIEKAVASLVKDGFILCENEQIQLA